MEQRTLANWMFEASAIFIAVLAAELVLLLLQHRMGVLSAFLEQTGTPPTPSAGYQDNIKAEV